MSSPVDCSVGHSSAIHEIGVVVDWAGRPGGDSEIVAVTTSSEGQGDAHRALASSPSSQYIAILSDIWDGGNRRGGGDGRAGPERTRGITDDVAHARLFQSGATVANTSSDVKFVVLGLEFPAGSKPISCFHASLGCLEGRRWVASAKNKLWWMTPSWGTRGGDIPLETQFLLVELGEGQSRGEVGESDGDKERQLYACLLPLIWDGTFTGMLVGGEQVVPKKRGRGHGRSGAQGKQRYVACITFSEFGRG